MSFWTGKATWFPLTLPVFIFVIISVAHMMILLKTLDCLWLRSSLHNKISHDVSFTFFPTNFIFPNRRTICAEWNSKIFRRSLRVGHLFSVDLSWQDYAFRFAFSSCIWRKGLIFNRFQEKILNELSLWRKKNRSSLFSNSI